MLDFTKLVQQMQGISEHLTQEEASHRRVNTACTLMTQATKHQDELVDQLHEHQDRLLFAVAKPLEPLGTKVVIGCRACRWLRLTIRRW